MIGQQKKGKVIKKNADMLTPVGIFKRLKGNKKFLLESSFQHETKGNYSFIGANPYQEIIGNKNQTDVIDVVSGKKEHIPVNALHYLKENMPRFDTDIPIPFQGGAIGYVAYDAIRQFAVIGKDLPDEIGTPDYHFMIYQTVIAYEHRTETAYLITSNVNDETEAEMDERLATIQQQLDEHVDISDPTAKPVHFEPQLDKASFVQKIKQAQQFIHNKEATQIVLSQRMIAELDGDAFNFYRYLRSSNPSPYMFYIDFTDYLIIGTSPESLVQTSGRQVVTNPIAGTRPRGNSELDDLALEKELLADQKELKEHEMLVELSKNDFQFICKQDSIHVPVYMDIMKYEHVMHIVSEVHGELKDDQSSIDALISCLPAGTVSGSPKQRAMQIINELETVKRGFYAGGIGYIAFNHDINLAIAIRSIIVKDKKAYLQAGAGIVADSIPEKEYEETLHKAKSLTNINYN